MYDPETDSWSEHPPIPTARYGAGYGTINNTIYIISGNAVLTKAELICESYKPSSYTWERLNDIPTGRIRFGSTVVNGMIYGIGGESSGICEQYNPVGDSWTRMTNMPTPRSQCVAASANNKIYVIGGYDGYYLTKNEEFTPPTIIDDESGNSEKIEFIDLSFEPDIGVPNGEIIISATIKNLGDIVQSDTIQIKISEEEIISTEISLDPGETKEITSSWFPSNFGNYTVTANPGNIQKVIPIHGRMYNSENCVIINYGDKELLNDMLIDPIIPAWVTSNAISITLSVSTGGFGALFTPHFLSDLALSGLGEILQMEFEPNDIEVRVYDYPTGGTPAYYSVEDVEIIYKKVEEPISFMIIHGGGTNSPYGEEFNIKVTQSDVLPTPEPILNFDIECPETYYDTGFFVIFPKFGSIDNIGIWDVHISYEGKSTGFSVQVSEKLEENGSPGFEFIIIILAVALLLFWKRKNGK